ncbi:DUF3939 domain-containing protein [Halobacillus salinarum]|uniref:DUF3939 domain-containing protein n=1 Tax=Halobacillus salinarum TaxID=2932257 RepID=A0ABY4EIZ4_9BACI|nr:DUF3939 domain-containing protein [Halobacillus salinarum]UOQ43487.1 DUF3939 domain-containing protein [Halobacillus salinarum]
MMWNRKKKKQANQALEKKDLSIHDVRQAVHAYADDKPQSVPLSVLIHEDLTLDYELLSPYLHAIPTKIYYMSRETYQIFEEEDYQLAKDMDVVQEAVDEYMKQTQEIPIIESDPYKRINYYKLEKLNLLPYRPNREFYMTNEEFMITYKKPEN